MSLVQKLISIYLFVSLLPILFISILISSQGKNIIYNQSVEHMNTIVESAEGNILIFLNEKKIRTADWSTDGYVRSEIEAIIETNNQERAQAMGLYIKQNKQILDKSIILTDVFSLDGTVIASSAGERIGYREPNLTELNEEYAFDRVKNASFGQVFVSEIINEEGPGYPAESMINLSVPIISLKSGNVIGMMVNHISGEYFDKILSGEYQISLGALESILQKSKTLDIYLVNKNGMMLTKSRLINDAQLKQIVNTVPVKDCLGKATEYSGKYQNYLNQTVIGASMCPQEQPFMILAEINESEAMAFLNKMLNLIYSIAGLIALLTILVSIFFDKRLVGRVKNNLRAVEEIGRGNFDARVKICSHDAISQVGEGINRMATKLQETISKITESEEKFRSLIESSPDCIKVLDNTGKLLHLNKGGLAEHGFKTLEETKNWDYLKTIEDEFVPKIKKALAAALAGKNTSFDVRHKQKDGLVGRANREWCNMTFSPVVIDHNKINNILVVSRDVSEQKKMIERELDLSSLKSKFIQIISHQMRTPLSAISWNLEMLLGRQTGKTIKGQEEILRISYDATKKIISRIGDLDISLDIEEGKIKLEKEETPIVDLFNSVWKEELNSLKMKQIDGKVEYPKTPLPSIKIDPTKIRDVFYKLIDNAVAYTKNKGKIKMKFSEKEGGVFFEITDTGVGIPKSEQRHIFKRFYRASNASTMMPDASGLGLFIAKNYIEAHGGEIGFTSKEGDGSAFWFKLFN
jgi:two-component system sensor histidine kinase ResE